MKLPAPLFAIPFLLSSLGTGWAEIAMDSTVPNVVAFTSPDEVPALPANFITLSGNLPRIVAAKEQPYIVTADIYIPTGKTVTIEPGVVLLFKNFTGIHVEGRLMAQGTREKPIVFTSEFDRSYNPGATLQATPYDWNGMYIHEGGIGSTLEYCKIFFSVYGVTTLTRYIKFDQVGFQSNGRSDLTIEGKKQEITSDLYSYSRTINDARRDGVPVQVLMDPYAKKRSMLRYSGLSLLAGGSVSGLWFYLQAHRSETRLDELREKRKTIDINSPVVVYNDEYYQGLLRARNRDTGFMATCFSLAAFGGAGFAFSFTF